MEGHNMTYNSQQETLTIPEYGRNVQDLIQHCKAIEKKDLRQHTAEAIVDLMSRMNAPSKMTPEFHLKLWKHFLIIADFDIDIELPEGVEKEPGDGRLKPDMPAYPDQLKRFRHYGQTVQKMVDKALEMEDGPLKDQYFMIIASYMKLAYRTWNSEHYVSDEIVKEDLAAMTDRKVVIPDDVPIKFHNGIGNPAISHSQHTKRKGSNNKGKRNKNYRQRRKR